MPRVATDRLETVLGSKTPRQSPACLICRCDDVHFQFQKNGFEVFRCGQCGFQFVYPPPTEALLAEFYQRQDYFKGSGEFGYVDYESKRDFYLALFQEYLRRLERHGTRGRLLDMGCGHGDFLMLSRAAGWESYGLEISDSARQEAIRRSGAQVFSSISMLADKTEFFDVITLWEFIEHLPHPEEFLGQLLPLLKPGGLIALTTPNTKNLNALRSPDLWQEFKPPEHLQFFDFETLGRLLTSRFGLNIIEQRGVHQDFRLISKPWVETILEWALRLRARRPRRTDPLWWVYAVLVRLFKDVPRRLLIAVRALDSRLIHTGMFVIARK